MCLIKESISLMYFQIDTAEFSFEILSKKAKEKHSEVSVRFFAKSILSAHPCEKESKPQCSLSPSGNVVFVIIL